MIKIGITGGIGSGKSVVASLLEKDFGVPVYDSDSRAKALMLTDTSIREGLVALLGDQAYLPEGLNKPLLAKYLFASDENARRINAIVHPAVKRDFVSWSEEYRCQGCKAVAVESAILFESGMDLLVDMVIMVHAPLEVRITRTMKRDSASREQVEARIQAQMDDSEKYRMAQMVVENDGIIPLHPQLELLMQKINRQNRQIVCESRL